MSAAITLPLKEIKSNTNQTKSTLLIFSDWFAPGYRAGGPIRSVVNLAKALQHDLRIFILTSNMDHLSDAPYPDLAPDEWISFDQKIQVFYASQARQSLKMVSKIIQEIKPDAVYLNSMYSKTFTLFPLWLLFKGRMGCPVILAPRGMLKESALQFKNTKKRIFLQLFKGLKLHQKVQFHATTEEEARSVQKVFGPAVHPNVLQNLPAAVAPYQPKEKKGPTRFVFVGRIHPIKGLDYLLHCLKEVAAPVQLTIAGNKEDAAHWKKCQSLINTLPPHISIHDVGEVPHHQLHALLQEQHFLTLPTQGENFGHAIFESLAAGLPVLISNQTPWRNLCPQNIGWDLPLHDESAYIEALNKAAGMDQVTYKQWSLSAWQFASNYLERSNIKQQYLKLFFQKV